jgi:Dolichyl-phosphate-mannose-protein mannosyltransferase
VTSFFQRIAAAIKSFWKLHPLASIGILIVSATEIVLLCASIFSYQNYFGMYHDDGIYLVSAQSLKDNLGYRIASLPGEPFQTKYPIGYPLLLSLCLRVVPIFPNNLLVLENFQVILSVAAVILTAAYLVATKKVTLLIGLVVAAASLLNMRFVDFAPMLMSDMPNALLVVATMWCTELQLRKGDRFSPWVGVLLAAAVSTRLQSIVLAPALLLFYARRKRWKSIVSTFAIAGLVVAPQICWQLMVSKDIPEALSFYTNYVKHSYGTLPNSSTGYGAVKGSLDWAIIFQINTYFPGFEQIPYQFISPIFFFLLYNVGYLVLCIPALTGLVIKLRKVSLPALYWCFYATSLVLWPTKLEWRHLLPVIVFVYYFYFVGIRYYSRLFKGVVRCRKKYAEFCRIAAVTFCCYLVIGAGSLSLAKVRWLNAFRAAPPTAVDFRQAVAWVKSNTSADAVFVCNNDPVLYLYTGRHAIMPSRLELWRFVSDKYVDADSLLAAIRYSHATYVMNEPVFRSMGFAYKQLADSIAELNRQHPGFIVPVFESDNKLVTVYRIAN